MQTPLTMLFPAAYAQDDAPCGTIDEVALLSPVENAGAISIAGPISTRDTLLVRGWAVDGSRTRLAAGVVVTLGDQVVEAFYGDARRDVAAVLGDEMLVMCGFRAAIAAPAGTDGEQFVSAYAVSADGLRVTRLPGGVPVAIRQADAVVDVRLPKRAGFAAFHVDAVGFSDDPADDGVMVSELIVKRGTAVFVRGWAFDVSAGFRVGGVYLMLDGRDLVHGVVGYPRHDVANAQHNLCLRDCGFLIRYDTGALPPGTHRLRLGFISSDGLAHDDVDLPQTLTVLSGWL